MKAAANQSFENLSQVTDALSMKRRYGVEIILPGGERRYFRSKSCIKQEAEKEILAYVASIESYLNRPVFWRYAGDKIYRMGQLDAPKRMLQKKITKVILEFFDLD